MDIIETCSNQYSSLTRHEVFASIESLNKVVSNQRKRKAVILVADDNPYNLFVLELLFQEITEIQVELITA